MTELAIPLALGVQYIYYDTLHLDNVLLDLNSVQEHHLIVILSPNYQIHLDCLQEFPELTAQLRFLINSDKLHLGKIPYVFFNLFCVQLILLCRIRTLLTLILILWFWRFSESSSRCTWSKYKQKLFNLWHSLNLSFTRFSKVDNKYHFIKFFVELSLKYLIIYNQKLDDFIFFQVSPMKEELK